MDEKKRKRLERAERAREETRNDELGRRLQERIAYHEAILAEERQARERAPQRRWRFWRFRRAS
jgi:hypothetical protein